MNYDALIASIDETHSQTQKGASQAVNQQLVMRNWLIGAYLIEYEQKGKDRADYGVQLLKNVAKDLRRKDIPGCSTHMLGRMRLLFRK